MKFMSIEEKVEFAKSLKGGDYVYIGFENGASFLSIVESVEDSKDILKINEFVTSVYEMGKGDDEDEIDFMYYHTQSVLYKYAPSNCNFYMIRKATLGEKRHLNKLLKDDVLAEETCNKLKKLLNK